MMVEIPQFGAFLPPRPVSKEEARELREKVKAMGKEGLKKLLLEKGWSEYSADMLHTVIYDSVMEAET